MNLFFLLYLNCIACLVLPVFTFKWLLFTQVICLKSNSCVLGSLSVQAPDRVELVAPPTWPDLKLEHLDYSSTAQLFFEFSFVHFNDLNVQMCISFYTALIVKCLSIWNSFMVFIHYRILVQQSSYFKSQSKWYCMVYSYLLCSIPGLLWRINVCIQRDYHTFLGKSDENVTWGLNILGRLIIGNCFTFF